MSTYDIKLKITYSYEYPAQASRAILRMLPLTSDTQRLVHGFVSAEPPPDEQINRRDFFGNAMTEVAYDRSLSEVAFRFSGRVRRRHYPVELDLTVSLDKLADELVDFKSLAPDSPHHFLGPSDRIRMSPKIAAFAREHIYPGISVRSAVLAISHALHEAMTFDSSATEVTTEPEAAFLDRRGVCQDFSHIMISALRSIGIPAGYVSGFLRTIPPEGQERLEGADAMHAWVRAWCGMEAGWLEFDPTNDMMVNSDHVTVAFGRDYADVAPIKGALRSSGQQKTSQQVDVVPAVPILPRR